MIAKSLGTLAISAIVWLLVLVAAAQLSTWIDWTVFGVSSML